MDGGKKQTSVRNRIFIVVLLAAKKRIFAVLGAVINIARIVVQKWKVMTLCDAKTFLQQVKLYDTHINCKLEEIARLKALSTKITTTYGKEVVSSSGNQDKLGDVVSKILDLEKEANAIIDTYINLKKEVDDVINEVSDPDEVAVLRKLYFLYEPWERIACEMHLSVRQTQRIHGNALITVNKILKQKMS